MGVVAVGDSAHRMPQDFNRRLGNVFVVIGGTRLSQILENPRLFFAGLQVRFWFDPSKGAKFSKLDVWSGTSAKKDWTVRLEILWHQTLKMGMDNAIHRPVESLAGLDPTIE